MKNIFATIEYVAEKILEAITGHKNDEQAHPNLSEQINDLSGKVDLGIMREGTLLNFVLTHGRSGGRGSNTYEASMTDIPEQRWGSFEVIPHASAIWTVIWYSDNDSVGYKRQIYVDNWKDEWEQIATTTKTNISSSSLLNGWTMWGNGYGDNLVGCKTGKQVQLNGLLRCGVKTQNTLILTLPEELRPTCSIIKNVSCYPYGTATIEIQSVGNVLVGNIGEGTLAISMGDVSYFTL